MWSKQGIYNKLNREGKSIRKYPNGDDPLKIKLFGKTRECIKCGKRKSILKFHWKSFYKTKTQKIRRIQAQCGECRVKYDNIKYSRTPEAYIRRRLMNLKQDCRSKRGRKKVLLTYKQLIAIYKRQVKRRARMGVRTGAGRGVNAVRRIDGVRKRGLDQRVAVRDFEGL